MACLRLETGKVTLPCYIALIWASLVLSACGGGSGNATGGGGNTMVPQAGPNAVLNGASLATATSHWVSTDCSVQAELTGDHGFYSVVVDSRGTTSSGPEAWTVGSNANSVTVGPGVGGLAGFFWISALDNITGSTSSETFTAGVVVQTGSTGQSLGTCAFVLKGGALGQPAT
jgi:hypothetical protein